MRSWPRVTVGWRNAGSSSTRNSASRRPSARSISNGASRVTKKSPPSRRYAGPCWLVKQTPSRRSHVLGHGLQTMFLHDSTGCPTPHYGRRGRPGPGAQPDQIVYHIVGALASRLTDRRARIDQQSCFILATNALDEGQLAARRGSRVIKGKPGQNVGFASSKTRNFWPRPSISKSLSVSWPC